MYLIYPAVFFGPKNLRPPYGGRPSATVSVCGLLNMPGLAVEFRRARAGHGGDRWSRQRGLWRRRDRKGRDPGYSHLGTWNSAADATRVREVAFEGSLGRDRQARQTGLPWRCWRLERYTQRRKSSKPRDRWTRCSWKYFGERRGLTGHYDQSTMSAGQSVRGDF